MKLPRPWVVPSNLTWPKVFGLHGWGSRYGIGPAYGRLREAATITEKLRQFNGVVVMLPTGQFWVLFLREDPRPVMAPSTDSSTPVHDHHHHQDEQDIVIHPVPVDLHLSPEFLQLRENGHTSES